MSLRKFLLAMFLAASGISPTAAQDEESAPLHLDHLPDCLTAAESNGREALAAARDWVEREPGPASHQCLSMVQADLGSIEAAIDSLERAAQLTDPGEEFSAANLLANAGQFAVILGQRERAIAFFDRAAALPGLYDDYRGKMIFYRAAAHASFGEFESASVDLAEARRLAPDDMDILLASADLAARDGDAEAVADYLARALQVDPTDAAIALRVGEIAHGYGAIEEARAAWGRAIELEPNGPVGELAAARLAETGDGEAAIEPPPSH